MTITRKLGLAYTGLSTVSLLLVVWLAYHEFVVEPRELAQYGIRDLDRDSWPEVIVVLFLGLTPILLGLGWWWMNHVLRPLQTLTQVLERIDVQNLRQPLPRTMNGDEVDKLSAVFNAMLERLDESFHRIHAFSLSASHELKTPLTVMRAQLEDALHEKKEGADTFAEKAAEMAWLESQLDEVHRLSEIVESLMLLARSDNGLVPLERRAVKLGDLVREAVCDAEILAHAQQLAVHLISYEDLLIEGDRHRLRQLLLVLTENAAKYNYPRGRVDFALEKIGEMAELTITNTVQKEVSPNLDSLFDPFVRGENEFTQTDGCGLGLSIARWIVIAHGGSIQLSSDSARSFTVRIRLPLLS
jgi:signal transduction histidine kinase